MVHREHRELNRVERTLGAVAAVALAVIGVRLALGMLPSRAVALQSGRLAPWIILWTLTWIAAVSAVAVAGFLLIASRRTK